MSTEVKEYFNGDDLAANVWTTKYALKDNNGTIEEQTPDDMHQIVLLLLRLLITFLLLLILVRISQTSLSVVAA